MIWRSWHRLSRRARLLWRREAGTATIEFTILMPLAVFIFMASMEAGLYMVRHVMLERGLDLVIRDFRLGRLVSLDNNQLRDRLCKSASVIRNCDTQLKIWLQPINTSSWDIPRDEVYCADRNDSLHTPRLTGISDQGGSDQIFLIRVCALEKPLFPTTAMAVQMRADSATGYYQLYTATFAVSEPR